MKKGKIFSIMLVFLMMISFLPTNIYANDETKNIGQLTVTTYEQLENGLGDAADVSRDADGHINIKLNKNLKGQLNLIYQVLIMFLMLMEKHLMVIVKLQH